MCATMQKLRIRRALDRHEFSASGRRGWRRPAGPQSADGGRSKGGRSEPAATLGRRGEHQVPDQAQPAERAAPRPQQGGPYRAEDGREARRTLPRTPTTATTELRRGLPRPRQGRVGGLDPQAHGGPAEVPPGPRRDAAASVAAPSRPQRPNDSGSRRRPVSGLPAMAATSSGAARRRAPRPSAPGRPRPDASWRSFELVQREPARLLAVAPDLPVEPQSRRARRVGRRASAREAPAPGSGRGRARRCRPGSRGPPRDRRASPAAPRAPAEAARERAVAEVPDPLFAEALELRPHLVRPDRPAGERRRELLDRLVQVGGDLAEGRDAAPRRRAAESATPSPLRARHQPPRQVLAAERDLPHARRRP